MSVRTLLRPLAIALTVALASVSLSAAGTSAVVGWDPNPASEQVTGYILYWSSVSRDAPAFSGFDHQQDVGNVTEWTLDLPSDTSRCYFSVSAYNADGLISDYSDELGTVVVTPSATDGGGISPADPTVVELGGSLAVRMTPDAEFEIEALEIDGTSVGAVSTYTLTDIDAPLNLQARFVAAQQPGTQQFQVTLSPGAHGTVLPNGTMTVDEGASLTFTVTPESGYRVASVLVNGSNVGPVSAYTLSAIGQDVTVTATFAATEPSVADTDGDQIPDEWEVRYFGDLSVDPGVDSDQDGRNNYEEYLAGTNPVVAELDPALTPAIAYPVSGATVVSTSSELAVHNPINEEGLTLRYQFQVALSPDMQSPVAEVDDLAQGSLGLTKWSPTDPLANQSQYYWRVRCVSDAVASEWAPVGTFYVDTAGVSTTVELVSAEYVDASAPNSFEVVDSGSAIAGLGVDIPSAALPYDFILTVATVENPPVDGASRLVGKAVEFGPDGRLFGQEVTILLPYTDQMLADAGVTSAGDLDVLTYNTQTLQWQSIPGVVTDYVGQRLVARVAHFSMYSIGVASDDTPAEPPTVSGGGGGGGGCFIRSLW